jgi:hypothetical protein
VVSSEEDARDIHEHNEVGDDEAKPESLLNLLNDKQRSRHHLLEPFISSTNRVDEEDCEYVP